MESGWSVASDFGATLAELAMCLVGSREEFSLVECVLDHLLGIDRVNKDVNSTRTPCYDDLDVLWLPGTMYNL